MAAKILSLNVGLPRTVDWKGRTVSTGIFKGPVSGRVRLHSLNFDGDRQADLTVHGGPNKAGYVYPVEHYDFWKREMPDVVLTWGIFGENLTTVGMDEATLQIGDRFRLGSAEVVVTQPRLPCYKLGIRFGRDDIVKRFLASGRLGFYVGVVTEGEVAAGDELILKERAKDTLPLSEIARLYARDKDDLEGLQRIIQVAALPEDWRDFFKEQIQRVGARKRQSAGGHPAWAGFRAFTLRDKSRESEDVSSFYLVPKDGRPLPAYLPGQFLTVRSTIAGVARPVVRCYSLSDTSQPDHYRVTIRHIRPGRRPSHPEAGLLSTYIHDQLRVGDSLEVKAPVGTFTLDASRPGSPVVLIAGGIGITPLFAMLKSIAGMVEPRDVTLLYSVRDSSDYILRAELGAIARTHPKLRIRVFYSRPSQKVDDPEVHVGHTDLDAMKRMLPSNDGDFYICGPSGMMDAVTRDLALWGVPHDRVHREAFSPAIVRQTTREAGQSDRSFDVAFERSGITAQWGGDEASLLDLAEEYDVPIDFGCRVGSCGTCVTRLLSGAVRYLHPPEAPLEAGKVLPCVAVPTGPLRLDA